MVPQRTRNQAGPASTRLLWANRQRAVRIDLERIQKIVEAAIPLCAEKPRRKGLRLPALIEITLLGGTAIAKVHGEFLGDPTPTDVITFEHGEILIGVTVAAENAPKIRHSVDHEVALCGIHGFLHLLGYDDLTEKEQIIMHRRQDEILEAALLRVC